VLAIDPKNEIALNKKGTDLFIYGSLGSISAQPTNLRAIFNQIENSIVQIKATTPNPNMQIISESIS